MPTTDERREVAARLREKHGERQGTIQARNMYIQAMSILDDLVECLPKRRDMFLDLADLIEPEPERTCRIIIAEGENNEGLNVCSECGKLHFGTPFCAYCGAKVVD